jgi:PIN domain nuclease of toxin-antitoxin system
VVLDTSALLYWTLEPAALPTAARRAINEALATAGCVVSAISLWEIALKVKRGRLAIGMPVEQFADRLARVEGLDIAPVDAAIWLRNVALPWEHRDPADRTIVATAELLGARLVTSDAEIGAYYPRVVW